MARYKVHKGPMCQTCVPVPLCRNIFGNVVFHKQYPRLYGTNKELRTKGIFLGLCPLYHSFAFVFVFFTCYYISDLFDWRPAMRSTALLRMIPTENHINQSLFKQCNAMIESLSKTISIQRFIKKCFKFPHLRSSLNRQ